MHMDGRFINTPAYRYGFNGQEKDDEVKGEANALEFGGRSIYDPRLARFVSVDPRWRSYSSISPYNYAANSPILFKDINGEAAGTGDGRSFPVDEGRSSFGAMVDPATGQLFRHTGTTEQKAAYQRYLTGVANDP